MKINKLIRYDNFSLLTFQTYKQAFYLMYTLNGMIFVTSKVRYTVIGIEFHKSSKFWIFRTVIIV